MIKVITDYVYFLKLKLNFESSNLLNSGPKNQTKTQLNQQSNNLSSSNKNKNKKTINIDQFIILFTGDNYFWSLARYFISGIKVYCMENWI